MGLTREEAYEILELPLGVDQDSIRTSYKRLALKWHPDKHTTSGEASWKFQQISRAYRRLTSVEQTDSMTMDQMLSLFKDVFFARNVNSYNGSGYDSSDDDDDDDDDFEDEVRYSNLFPDKLKLKQDWKRARAGDNDISGKTLSPEEIDRNALELITEEEKEKRKAEKRRAKKKRRREKKKLEKTTEDMPKQEEKKTKEKKTKDSDQPEKSKKSDKKNETSSSDDAGFDPHSAFFTKVVNKKKKATPGSDAQVKSKKGDKSDEETEELDPKTLRSRQLAIKGNEMAHLGHYAAAIELFSEAIKLDPKDFRFFGNRSYCFDRIQQYEKALKDAEKAIHLAKDWPKGYFRKGRALAGLKMFPDAEVAFTQVLKLDKNCEDAVQELLRVRTHQIMEMGFTRQQSEAAIKQYGTVQSALDSLLAGVVAENSLSSEVYVSDDDDGFIVPSQPAIQQHQPQTADTKMDPKNPEGLTALWVGNVLPEVSDKRLQQMFSRFGQVKSVRCLPEKYCAFVNFATKEAAGKAMHSLQGHECNGQRLLIKFPDNPIVNGGGNFTIRKQQNNTPKSSEPSTITIGSAVNKNASKVKGPVNGNECYFWRTTGCTYGDKCRHSHLPEHKVRTWGSGTVGEGGTYDGVAMDIPVKVSLPLLGIGVFTLLLSFVFCCYMWKLKRRARQEEGYRRIHFSPQKKKKLPNDTCPVCLDEFQMKEKIVMCPCQHVFHSKCLLEWLRHKNSCPMCKAPVRSIADERAGLPIETSGLVRHSISPRATNNTAASNV